MIEADQIKIFVNKQLHEEGPTVYIWEIVVLKITKFTSKTKQKKEINLTKISKPSTFPYYEGYTYFLHTE